MNIGNWLIGLLLKYVVGKQFGFGPIAVDIDGNKLTVSGNISVQAG